LEQQYSGLSEKMTTQVTQIKSLNEQNKKIHEVIEEKDKQIDEKTHFAETQEKTKAELINKL